MALKVDVFSPPKSRYRSLHYMTEKLGQALARQGVECRLFDSRNAADPQGMINSIISNRTSFTLSFNGLLPDDDGNFFCDFLGVPHVAYLVDSPNQFFPLVKSPLTLVANVDRFYTDFFKNFKVTDSFFLPHAADSNLSQNPSTTRDIDILFLSSFIDHEEIQKEWSKKYPKVLVDVLNRAANATLSDQKTSYIEALTAALNEAVEKKLLNPSDLDFPQVMTELEDYIRGKDKVELLRAIKTGHIHIYGEGNWKKITPSLHTKVTVHPPIDYAEGLELMKKAKIVLSSSPSIKQGGHDRVFNGMAAGALIITSENPYIAGQFKDQKDLVFYRHGHWNEINSQIEKYLKDEKARQTVAESGKKIVLEKHTWDVRAKELLTHLTPVIKNLQQKLAANNSISGK